MKRYLFLLSLLPIHLFSQDYELLLTPNKYWDVVEWADGLNGGGGPMDEIRGGRQFVSGDTIINGETYQIIREYSMHNVEHESWFAPPFSFTNESSIVGFMREDSVHKKVFTYDENEKTEILTYDFSLSPGDSLHVPYLGDSYVLDTIINVTLLDGSLTRKFIFKGLPNNYYIEGIGGESRLLLPFDYDFEWGWYIDGVLRDNKKIYCQGGSCFVVTKNETVLEQANEFSIYPNPVQNKLYIQCLSTVTGVVEVYGLDGSLLKSQKLMETQPETKFDMSQLPAGVYILSIATAHQNMRKSIIKY